jgi:RNA polymerase sigma-70 factor (ECF subfamily)
MRPDDPDPSRRAGFWSGVLRRDYRALFGVAIALCRQPADAEDLVHDTLLDLARSARRIEDPVAYAARSMRNRRLNAIKRESREAGFVSVRATVDTARSASDRTSELLSAVERLPADQQEIVVLRTRSGLSFPQIALVLDEPVGTVSSRYSRAIAALKEMLLEGANHA